MLANTSLISTIALMEWFTPTFLTHARAVPGFPTPSAWPASRAFTTLPNGFWAIYADAADDLLISQTLVETSDRFRETVAALGVRDVALNATDVVKYPNYAHWMNTPEEVWGSALPRLLEIQERYDPEGVMRLTGGFKLQ